MARRNLKEAMGKGNEIPKSREEYLEEKKAKEAAETVDMKYKAVEAPRIDLEPVANVSVPELKTMPLNSSEYVKKGYYNLTEQNYWYLKDITFYKNTQIQDYLNYLIEKDRAEHKDILHVLPHCN
ncbi:MAG: hypothetical protein J6Y78_08505 [Paludibacteraceae bacterium]|nr:hypothetical protein [Paludibacteraceae bacterium]